MKIKVTTALWKDKTVGVGSVLIDGKPWTCSFAGKLKSEINVTEYGKSVLFTPFDPEEITKISNTIDLVNETLCADYDIKPLFKENARNMFFKIKNIPKNNIGLTEDSEVVEDLEAVTVKFQICHYLNADDHVQGYYTKLVSIMNENAKPEKKRKKD